MKKILVSFEGKMESWINDQMEERSQSASTVVRGAVYQAMNGDKNPELADIPIEPKRGPGRPPKIKEPEPEKVYTVENPPMEDREVGQWILCQLKLVQSEGKPVSLKQVVAISEDVKNIFMILVKRNQNGHRNTKGILDGVDYLVKKGLIARTAEFDGKYDPIYEIIGG